MKKDYKYHYVYRITNTVTGYHYYGSKSCDEYPTENIGKKYQSSSRNRFFIQDQKDNPEDYKYKVIKIFETCRPDATSLEIKLHAKFDVKNHPKFINRSNQTSKKFDTTGMEFHFSDSHRNKIRISQLKNNSFKGKTHTLDVIEKIIAAQLGSTKTMETKLKISNSLKGKKKSKQHCKKMSEAMKGRKISDVTKEKMSKTHKEIFNPKNHNWSKHIKIFDADGIEQFDCYGEFGKICKENNLPQNALTSSYKNDGKPIFNYTRKCDITRLEKRNQLIFKGWFAIEIP